MKIKRRITQTVDAGTCTPGDVVSWADELWLIVDDSDVPGTPAVRLSDGRKAAWHNTGLVTPVKGAFVEE